MPDQDKSSVVALNYASPAALALPNPKLLKSAVVLALIPLATGCAIFLLWLVIRADILQILGFFTIFAGLVLIAGGAICLLVHFVSVLRQKPDAGKKRAIIIDFLVAGLLLSNFPTCALIIGVVERIQNQFTVTVQNRGTVTITSAIVNQGSNTIDLGAILPGAVASTSMYPTGGAVTLSIVRSDKTTGTVQLTPYLDDDDTRGGKLRLTATDASGTLSADRQN